MNPNTVISLAEGSLIKRARRGSSEAFSELVRLHSHHIYGVSLRILKNHADAEDNLQDVLCRVYQNIHRFQGRSRFSSWLVRITINEALMKIRKESSLLVRRQTALPEQDGEDRSHWDITDGQPSPERRYIAAEMAMKAFKGLHPALRRTFILHKGDGWTQRELAGAMGIAVSAIKSRIFRARATMQRQLRPQI